LDSIINFRYQNLDNKILITKIDNLKGSVHGDTSIGFSKLPSGYYRGSVWNHNWVNWDL